MEFGQAMGGFASFWVGSGIFLSVLLMIVSLFFFSYCLFLFSPSHIHTSFLELQLFRFGTKNGKPADSLMKSHTYILQPVTGNAKYWKLHANELANGGQPLQKASVNLDDVTLCLSRVFSYIPFHASTLRVIVFKRFWFA